MNKSNYNYTMSSMYQMVGISKQGHYKRVGCQKKQSVLGEAVLKSAQKIRKSHPRMGCRKLYDKINPEGIGRDKTEAILLCNGFRVNRKRNYHRTTYARRKWYSNLISGMEVTHTNQLWVSDITYISIANNQRYYLTLILDVYSGKITGWELSSGMRSEQTVMPAYQKGLGSINEGQCKGLIFHSDRGSQYSYKELEALHHQHGVLPSMGGKAWENAHAESINGILKNEYINFENMNVSLNQARKMVKTIIDLYNHDRPHGSLKNMKPVEFENFVQQLAALLKLTLILD